MPGARDVAATGACAVLQQGHARSDGGVACLGLALKMDGGCAIAAGPERSEVMDEVARSDLVLHRFGGRAKRALALQGIDGSVVEVDDVVGLQEPVDATRTEALSSCIRGREGIRAFIR